MRPLVVLAFVVGLGASCSKPATTTPNSVLGFPTDDLDSLAVHEAVVRTVPDTSRVGEYARAMSQAPHHTGSRGARMVAEWARGQLEAFGLDAKIEEYEALLPTPISRSVELVAPTHYTAVMQEPVLREDSDSGDEDQLPTSNAYGADGDVTGDLVFANYGLAEDYAVLDSLGVDLTGKIVIVKYGRGVRSSKIKQAVSRGAVGCLIYSDPQDDGFVRDVILEGAAGVPKTACSEERWRTTRPSILATPLSPAGVGSGSRRPSREEARSLPSIPVLPLSYGDARPLLEHLGGRSAPSTWKGGLPIDYRLGPGPARVHMTSQSDWKTGTPYDVVARIPGATMPDEADRRQLVTTAG
ncbi:MAG: PA domain-containing protein [Gemmatimonadaceae bacterium]